MKSSTLLQTERRLLAPALELIFGTGFESLCGEFQTRGKKKENSESPFHGEEAMSIRAITSKNNTKADIVERGKNLNGAILSSPVRLKAFWGGHPRRSQLLILRPFP